MADLASLQSMIEQLARDQKSRDEALRQAFGLFTDALKRLQATVDAIHEAATAEHPPSQVPPLLEEIKAMLAAQPGLIAKAIRAVLSERH